MPKEPLRVSLSAVSAFRECQQLYYYRYVEGLRRKDKALAPQLGIMLHDYLEIYYKEIKDKIPPKTAHADALLIFKKKYQKECAEMAQTLSGMGQQGLALEILDLPKKAARIAERYFVVHGREDADRFEIILVEEELKLPMFRGRVVSIGRLDMITRDRDSGIVYIWEHKSTTEIPAVGYRLRDLQTPLYRHKIEQLGLAPKIDCVLWNYIKTKEPEIPAQLKNGTLTRKKSLDSTWGIFLKVLTELALDENDYQDQKARLSGREERIFFPRYNQPILSQFDTLYRDYRESIKEIGRARADWRQGIRAPVRTLSRSCNWCEMSTLCTAAILAGDDRDVKDLRFNKAAWSTSGGRL